MGELMPETMSVMDQMLRLGCVFHCQSVSGERLIEVNTSLDLRDEHVTEAFAWRAETALVQAIANLVYSGTNNRATSSQLAIHDAEQNSQPTDTSRFDYMVWNGYARLHYDRDSDKTIGFSSHGRRNGGDLTAVGNTGLEAMMGLARNYYAGGFFSETGRRFRTSPLVDLSLLQVPENSAQRYAIKDRGV